MVRMIFIRVSNRLPPNKVPAQKMSARKFCFALVFMVVTACGGGGSGDGLPDPPSSSPPTVLPPGTPAPVPTVADITLLFMGNSHTQSNQLTTMVEEMVRAGSPGRTVASAVAPATLFLDEHLRNARTMTLLRNQNWSFVILQAQKYSSSGQTDFSTEEARELVRISRQQRAVPVMFPEWPRLGIDETRRIYDLHVSIALAEPACVAPIGQAWDLAMARDPALVLHATDGNHSAPAGAFLAALVLYATISGKSPLDLPTFSQYPVDASLQQFLRGIAAEAVQTVPPRMWCPGDAI
jgi:hypothetical protein